MTETLPTNGSLCRACGGPVWLLLSMFGPICKGCYAAGKGRPHD